MIGPVQLIAIMVALAATYVLGRVGALLAEHAITEWLDARRVAGILSRTALDNATAARGLAEHLTEPTDEPLFEATRSAFPDFPSWDEMVANYAEPRDYDLAVTLPPAGYTRDPLAWPDSDADGVLVVPSLTGPLSSGDAELALSPARPPLYAKLRAAADARERHELFGLPVVVDGRMPHAAIVGPDGATVLIAHHDGTTEPAPEADRG